MPVVIQNTESRSDFAKLKGTGNTGGDCTGPATINTSECAECGQGSSGFAHAATISTLLD